MASSKKTTASLFNNMSSLGNKVEENIEEKNEPTKIEATKTNTEIIQKEEPIIQSLENTADEIKKENTKEIALIKADKTNVGKKTVSFTTPGEIKDKLQRYSIAFPDSISQYITDLIIKDFSENESKYEEIATLLEKVKGLR